MNKLIILISAITLFLFPVNEDNVIIGQSNCIACRVINNQLTIDDYVTTCEPMVIDTDDYMFFSLYAGQSNTGGRVFSDWGSNYQVTYPNNFEYLFDGNGNSQTINTQMIGSNWVNGAEKIYSPLMQNLLGEDLYTLRVFRGGTCLCDEEPSDDNNFHPQNGNYYQEILQAITTAKQYAYTNGKIPVFTNFNWVHGTCDSNTYGTCTADYESHLSELIQNVWTAIGCEVPTNLNQLPDGISTGAGAVAVNQAINNVASTSSMITVCDSSTFPTSDGTHFTASSNTQIGGLEMIANCMFQNTLTMCNQ